MHNAFDPEMVGSSRRTEEMEANPKVRSVVLVGAGGTFCAGADISHMKKKRKVHRKQNHDAAMQRRACSTPCIRSRSPDRLHPRGRARRRCGLVAACDIAIAARTATFRLSEVKLGVIRP